MSISTLSRVFALGLSSIGASHGLDRAPSTRMTAAGMDRAGSGQGPVQGESPTPEGALTGRVVARNGQPISDVFVTVLTPGPVGPAPFGRNMRPVGLTNERGEFRINGLRPGEY